MTVEEQKRLYDLVMTPPPGSKIEAAKAYGVDLSLNLRSLKLSPTERANEMIRALRFLRQMEHAWAQQANDPPRN